MAFEDERGDLGAAEAKGREEADWPGTDYKDRRVGVKLWDVLAGTQKWECVQFMASRQK